MALERKKLEELDHFIEMVVQGKANALIVLSEAGIGKTHRIMDKLDALKANTRYRSGHITPLELYTDLYNGREEKDITFYDDTEALLVEPKNISLLKPALWPVKGKRTITYFSSTELLKVPKSFEYQGKVILALNQIPRKADKSVQAFLSRAHFIELELTFQEKKELFYEISEHDYKDLSHEQRKEVLAYIFDNTNEASEDLNIRTVQKAWDIRSYNTTNWKNQLSCLFKTNFELETCRQLSEQYSNEQAIQEWKKATGYSRSTFYKNKKILKERGWKQ
jgi:hypothetical protein